MESTGGKPVLTNGGTTAGNKIDAGEKLTLTKADAGEKLTLTKADAGEKLTLTKS